MCGKAKRPIRTIFKNKNKISLQCNECQHVRDRRLMLTGTGKRKPAPAAPLRKSESYTKSCDEESLDGGPCNQRSSLPAADPVSALPVDPYLPQCHQKSGLVLPEGVCGLQCVHHTHPSLLHSRLELLGVTLQQRIMRTGVISFRIEVVGVQTYNAQSLQLSEWLKIFIITCRMRWYCRRQNMGKCSL